MCCVTGQGPVECCWVVAQLAKLIIHETENQGVESEIIGTIGGDAPIYLNLC